MKTFSHYRPSVLLYVTEMKKDGLLVALILRAANQSVSLEELRLTIKIIKPTAALPDKVHTLIC